MIHLSKRMQMVADLLPGGWTVADVGCDHGFVSIYLAERDIVPGVIAMDVNEGPLQRAETHVREHHLEDRIEIRLSDGLKAVQTGEVDGAVIAGMGGRLILKILQDCPEKVKHMKGLVLQPQSDWELLRTALWQSGFSFVSESMTEEDHKFYTAFLVSFTGRHDRDLTPEEAAFGPLLLQKRDEVLLKYIRKEKKKFQEIAARIEKGKTGKTDVEQKIGLLNRALILYAQEGDNHEL